MIKQYRLKAGLSQAQLASKLGYRSAQFISNIERGLATLPPVKFRKVATLLNIPMEELIAARTAEDEKRLRRAIK